MISAPHFGPGYDDIRIIGDELFFAGELVALLATSAPASTMGRFTDLIEFGEDAEAPCDCPPRLHKSTCDFHKAEDGEPPDPTEERNDVLEAARRLARGGLVRLADLEREFSS